jgi:tetratricopeptide (TPR) repeat protein
MRKIVYLLMAMMIPATVIGKATTLLDSLGPAYAALSDTGKIGYLIRAANAEKIRNPALGLRMVRLGMTSSKGRHSGYRLGDLQMQEGAMHWFLGQLDSASIVLEEARSHFLRTGDSCGVARAEHNICMVYNDKGFLELALQAGLRAMAYFERQGDTTRLTTMYNTVGTTYNALDDYVKAQHYYRRALAFAEIRRDTTLIAYITNNLGNTLLTIHAYQEAEVFLLRSMDAYNLQNNLSGMSKVCVNLAKVYRIQGRTDQAEALLRRAITLAEASPNDYQLGVVYFGLAEFEFLTGNYRLAIEAGKKTLQVGLRVGGLRLISQTHDLLAGAYEGLGEHAAALAHHKDFKRLNDSIFSQAKSRAVAEFNLMYESAAKDSEIQRLDQARRLSQLRVTTLTVLIFLLLACGLLIYLRHRAVRHRERLLEHKDREMQQAKSALMAAEAARLQDEVHYKSREITTLAMYILSKNELLVSLDAELRQLRRGSADGEGRLKELGQRVAQALSSERERQEIELSIESAHQGFLHTLETRYPELTIKERRLCGMIRQGLSSKEIAAIFAINTSSVEISRHRIRKKLALEAQQDLYAFVMNI